MGEDMSIFQAFEQLQAMLRDFAPLVKSYHDHLIEEGFSENEAFVLTLEYQTCFMNAAFNPKR